MPGPWKEWKTKDRFSTLATAPWKSRQPREISTFPQLRRAAPGKVENQNQVSHFPTRDPRRLRRFFSKHQNQNQTSPPPAAKEQTKEGELHAAK